MAQTPTTPTTPSRDKYLSKLSSVSIPDQSISQFVLERCDDFGERVAFIEGGSDRSIRFHQLPEQVRRLASCLVGAPLSVSKGSVVAICATNMPEYLVLYHAVLSVGGVVSPINPTYTSDEIKHQLVDSGAVVVAVCGSTLEVTKEASSTVSAIRGTIVLDGEGDGGARIHPYATMLALGDPDFVSQVVIDPKKDLALLPYSSGTTGLSKGVKLTHFNVVANICQITHPQLVAIGRDDVLLAVLPFFHMFGLMVFLNISVRYGARTVTVPKFEPRTYLALLAKHKVTIAHVVPPLVAFLAKNDLVEPYVGDLRGHLKEVFCGAAPLGQDLGMLLQNRLGVHLRQAYGMTEMSPASHVALSGSPKLSSCGVLIPNTEAKLLDANGDVVGVYEQGELCVRGPQIMQGYLNNDAATANCMLPDGFMRTGDVAVMDEDGCYYIVDRLKELIKCKGNQVPPAEVEAKLMEHVNIADAAVVGIADDRDGEVPKAFVVKRGEITEDEVIAFCAKSLATYKVPRQVEFVESIPKSASGKILRRELRDRM